VPAATPRPPPTQTAARQKPLIRQIAHNTQPRAAGLCAVNALFARYPHTMMPRVARSRRKTDEQTAKQSLGSGRGLAVPNPDACSLAHHSVRKLGAGLEPLEEAGQTGSALSIAPRLFSPTSPCPGHDPDRSRSAGTSDCWASVTPGREPPDFGTGPPGPGQAQPRG
jgi:hypothetical protein